MAIKPKPGGPALLVRWIYTRDEWKAFERWKTKQQSVFHYLLHRLLPGRAHTSPEVTITDEHILINNITEPFNDAGRQLKRVYIRDTGNLNIMEITYENDGSGEMNEIKIPVPKGKLREAIAIQESLLVERLIG